MNFIGQGFEKLQHYRQTGPARDLSDIPATSDTAAQLWVFLVRGPDPRIRGSLVKISGLMRIKVIRSAVLPHRKVSFPYMKLR